jgi:hypothetical protein
VSYVCFLSSNLTHNLRIVSRADVLTINPSPTPQPGERWSLHLLFQADETIHHLLVGCVSSREVWFRLLRRAGFPSSYHNKMIASTSGGYAAASVCQKMVMVAKASRHSGRAHCLRNLERAQRSRLQPQLAPGVAAGEPYKRWRSPLGRNRVLLLGRLPAVVCLSVCFTQPKQP